MGARRKKEKRKTRGEEGLLRGRFEGGVHPALERINRSFDVDVRMWAEDIAGSMAHALMLAETGILTKAAARRIVKGLEKVSREFEDGTFEAHDSDEDVHMAVERRLTELIGPDGARLHTARSRNDQVATDLRLYCGGLSERISIQVRAVQRVLLDRAAQDGDAVLPFYTHLQRAQPVLLGHVLLAYVEMLESDRKQAHYELDECPLGACAGAGTSFPIDRKLTAKLLEFRRPSPNSIEAVSSRADVARVVGGLAALGVTLSRLGAELVLWCSREFGFARLGDAVTTGSSIMPQKRNPDGAELLRAKAATVSAAHGRLLEIQRGLPLGYFKDLQEDKAALFEAEDAIGDMLAVAEAMFEDVTFDARRMYAAVADPSGYMLATEAADALVRKGVPFREAHEAVGRLVREAEAAGVDLAALSLDRFRAAHPKFDEADRAMLTPAEALRARRAVGGPSPANVRRQIRRWRRKLGQGPA